jgi:C4-dicarboxylate transporter DctM subunit
MATAWLIGKKRGYKGSGKKVRAKDALAAAWDAKWALCMPVIILGGIYGGIFTPTEAAVVGTVYGLFVGFFVYREMSIAKLLKVVADNGSLFGAAFFIFGFATSLSFLVSMTMLPDRISDMLSAVSTNPNVIMFIVVVFLLILGMLMDTMSANLIFSPFLLSIVVPLGINPVHFGIVVTVALALGFVTPPMATNLFLAASLFDTPMQNIAKAAFPFIISMTAALFIICYFPGISLFLVNIMK